MALFSVRVTASFADALDGRSKSEGEGQGGG